MTKRSITPYIRRELSDFSGGLNTEHPATISEDELVKARNCVLTSTRRIRPRPGIYRRFETDFSGSPVLGMGALYKSDGTTRLVVASETSLYADKPHIIFNYDSQTDWQQSGVYTNLDTVSSPGDVRMLEILSDGFEDGTFGKWTSADSGWTIDTSVYKTGTRSAKGTGTQQKLIYDFKQNRTSVYVKLACRFAETNQVHYPVIFISPSGSQIQAVVADSDGHFKYHNGSALTNFTTDTTYSANTWYTIEVWASNGTFWVSINGTSITPSSLAVKDTANTAQTQVAKFQAQNAGTTAATMWLDDVTINPVAVVFSRSSAAYKSDGTQVAANQPRYEYAALPVPVWQDTFDTDQLSQYTSGGDVAATWTVSGGVLTGTGGTQATLIKNNLNLSDADIVINSDQAADGGIVGRYVDNSNYYLLTLTDNETSFKNGGFEIYSGTSGVADYWTGANGPVGTATFSIDSTTKYAGNQSQKIISTKSFSNAGPVAVLSQTVDCGAGIALTFSGYVMFDSALAGCSAAFVIEALDSAGGVLRSNSTYVASAAAWTFGSVSYTTPANTIKVRFSVQIIGAQAVPWTDKVCWIDACTVTGIQSEVPSLALFRRSAGAFTQLASAYVNWPRGTAKQIKFTLHGSQLEAYFDGVKVISVTDTTFTGGQVGLWNNSDTAFRVLDFTVYDASQQRVMQGVMVEEGTTNKIETEGGGASQDWSKWYHWGNRTYWQSETQYDDPVMGKVFKGVCNNPPYLFDYYPYSITNGVVYTVTIWLKASVAVSGLSARAYFLDSGGIFSLGYTTKTINLTTEWQKFEWQITATATSTAAGFGIGPLSIPAGTTVYAARPQLEQKPYATSFIDGTRSPESLTVPTAGVLNPQEGTVECWVYFPPGGKWSIAGQTSTIFWIGSNSTGVAANQIYADVDNQGTLRLVIYDNNANYKLIQTTSKITSGWHYLAYKWDSTGPLAICVDGVKQDTTTISTGTGVCSSVERFALGFNGYDNARQINSLIDDLRISSRARTDAEISAAYTSGLSLAWDVDTTYLLSFDGNLNLPSIRQGVWVSPVQNATQAIDYSNLIVNWVSTAPVNTAIACQVRTSSDGQSWSFWYDQVNNEYAAALPNKYSQVRFILQTLSGTATPVLSKATVSYEGQPTAESIYTGLSVSTHYDFAQLRDNLIICNGADIPKKYDGLTITDITQAPRAALVCAYKNRVFMADRGSRLYFSDLGSIDSWPAENFIDISPDDGDKITAILPGPIALLIVKQHNSYFLQGYSPQTFQVTLASDGGTISPNGIVWTPKGVFRIDRDGVWVTDFRESVLLSKKIQKIWDNLNTRLLERAALFYSDDKVFVAVPDGLSNTNNLLLVYDTIYKNWSVWDGWQPACFLNFWERGKWKCLFGSATTGNIYEIGEDLTDCGTPFDVEIETAHLPLVTVEFVNRLKWIDVFFAGGTTDNVVEVQTVVDGTPTSTKSLTVTGNQEVVNYRLFPPAYGSTMGLNVKIRSTNADGPCFLGAAFTYYPRAARPKRVI